MSRADLPARGWRKLQLSLFGLGVLTACLNFGPPPISRFSLYCLIPFAASLGCGLMVARSVGLRHLAWYWRDRLGSGLASDGINKQVWRGVRQVVNAAHADDGKKFRRLYVRLGKKLDTAEHQLMGRYVRYMLGYRIAETYGRAPDREQLHATTVRLAPRFKQLVGYDANALEDVLLTVFKMPSPGRAVEGGRLTVHASAIVGLLLDRPDFEMAVIRRPLSRTTAPVARPPQQTDTQAPAAATNDP